MEIQAEFDVAVIGSGPAGISAAINCAAMNKRVAIISSGAESSGLYRAQRIDNFPGEYGISGADLLKKLHRHAENMGVPIYTGKVLSIVPMGDKFGVSFGTEFTMASAVILAIGTVSQKTFPGEKEYLGRGVSYCAVCDGMLYRGKNICVYGDTDEAIGEAKYLRDIGCNVTYISKEKPSGDDINYITSNSLSIVGGERAEKVILDDTEIQCDGVFIMRPSVAPAVMLPGLQIQDGHIKAEQNGETSIPGVFAAGDCTGLPYQVAKAVGEGQTVAFAAVKYLNNRR